MAHHTPIIIAICSVVVHRKLYYDDNLGPDSITLNCKMPLDRLVQCVCACTDIQCLSKCLLELALVGTSVERHTAMMKYKIVTARCLGSACH